jgi:hypothetical protein
MMVVVVVVNNNNNNNNNNINSAPWSWLVDTAHTPIDCGVC